MDGKKYEKTVVGFWERNTFSSVAKPKRDDGNDDKVVIEDKKLMFSHFQPSFSAKVRKQSTNSSLLLAEFKTMKCIEQTLIHLYFRKRISYSWNKNVWEGKKYLKQNMNKEMVVYFMDRL